MDSVCKSWLTTHPFLVPVARLYGAVQAAVAAQVPAPLAPPDWSAWAEAARAGTPLLRTETFGPQLSARLAELLEGVARTLDASALPPELQAPLQGVRAQLSRGPQARQQAAAWVLSHGSAE